MEERNIVSVNGSATKMTANTAYLKLRLAEYIVAQYDYYKTDDIVHNILAETKVGARRRTDVPEILKTVFSTV